VSNSKAGRTGVMNSKLVSNSTVGSEILYSRE
jgi:hypothetical protein